jgi:hypothetical protein
MFWQGTFIVLVCRRGPDLPYMPGQEYRTVYPLIRLLPELFMFKNETVTRAQAGRLTTRRKTKHRRHCSTCKERRGTWTMVCPRCGKKTLMQKILIAVGICLLAIIFAKTLGVF